jgi:hypothetical protein
MNTITARNLAARVAELIELVSIFQARYGKQYRMKPGSPVEAWNLHQAIFDQQGVIARLLDTTALENPLHRCQPWWKWQDTMDTGLVMQLSQEVSHLIASCACFEAQPQGEMSHAVRSAQAALAGMLHPSSLMVALSDRIAAQRAS